MRMLAFEEADGINFARLIRHSSDCPISLLYQLSPAALLAAMDRKRELAALLAIIQATEALDDSTALPLHLLFNNSNSSLTAATAASFQSINS